MPKRVKQQKQHSRDVNEASRQLGDLSTGQLDSGRLQNNRVPKSVSQYMAEIGRKGGQIGGKQRLKTMSAIERHKVAQKAARARWERHNGLER